MASEIGKDRELELLRRELDRSEQRSRKLLQAIPQALLIVDGAGTIHGINPKASHLLGWAPKEVAGKSVKSMLTHCPVLFPLTADFTSTCFESQVTAKDGRTIFVDAEVANLDRENDAWLVSLSDITERHKIEAFKKSIIQMISHDLRSPLASLSVFLELVVEERMGAVPDALKRQGAVARSSCQRLLKLVEDLLEVERFSSGSLKTEIVTCRSSQLFESAIDSVSELANAKGIAIAVVGDDTEVSCDEGRIVQVLVNLLSNAIKASSEGENIEVGASPSLDFVELSVNDRGPGISDKETELVFERFFQGTNTGKGSGFGLGLAICREIVNAHKGTIGVRKNGDRGASFWFRLPK